MNRRNCRARQCSAVASTIMCNYTIAIHLHCFTIPPLDLDPTEGASVNTRLNLYSALLWPFYSSITSVQSSLMERLLLSSVVVSWMLILIEQCMRLFLVVDGDGVPPPLLTCHHLLCNAFHWRKGGFVLLLAVTKDLFSNDWWLGFMTTILLFLLGRIAPEDSLTDTRPGRERSVFSL